jgi:DNA-binding beta-propeller fold protein YncE
MRNSVIMMACLLLAIACKKDTTPPAPEESIINEDAATFREIASINIGGAGAAEISAYCDKTKRLFVVNNSAAVNRIEVVNLADPATPVIIANISLATYNGAANSVAVHDGRLAVALESTIKQDPGKVILFNTSTYAEIKNITVGALPDMITFSPDGRYLLTANEGEPNAAYTTDPDGSVSIIDINNNYIVTSLDFGAFNAQLTSLRSNGFRSFGPKRRFQNCLGNAAGK